MSRPKQPRTKSDQKLRAKWEKKLRDEGLGVMGNERHWTFPGVTTAGGVGFTSLDAVDENGEHFDAIDLFEADNVEAFGDQTKVADTPTAVFFQQFSQAVQKLPRTYSDRGFLVSFSECGYMSRAAKEHDLTRWEAEGILRRFCAKFDIDYSLLQDGVHHRVVKDPEYCHTCPPKFFVNKKGKQERMWHAPHAAPVRSLSKREIKRLGLTPPKKNN